MESFETSKNKIEKLFQQKETNNFQLENKLNNTKSKKLDEIYFSKLRTLYDSEWFLRAGSPVITSNIIQNKMTPVEYTWWHESVLQINEEFLPFIDFQTSYKSIEDRKFVPAIKYDNTRWRYNYIIVSTPLDVWSGYQPPTAIPTNNSTTNKADILITQERIDDGSALSSYTRPAWHCDIQWTNGGNTYRVLDGLLIGFYSKPYDTSSSPCGGHTNYYTVGGNLFYGSGIEYGAGDIINSGVINNDYLYVSGRRTHQYWTGTEEACVSHTDYTENYSKILNFPSDIEQLVVWGVIQQYISGNWVTLNSGRKYFATATGTLTSLTAYKKDFYLYYHTNKRFLLAVKNANVIPSALPSNPIELLNKPIKTFYDDLPTTNIYFKVNPGIYPIAGTYGETYYATGENNDMIDTFWIRTSKSTDSKQSWMGILYTSAYQLVKANQKTIENAPKWDDTYSPNGGATAYELTSTSHTTEERHVWRPDTNETVWMRILAAIRNPFYWKKTEKIISETK